MPNEPEPRVDVNLPIRVFGMDAEGKPFSQKAQARNISLHGAKVAGLEKQLKPGEVVGVQFGDQKTRCKVIWVVDAGPSEDRSRIKMVEGQPCPWQKEMAAPQTSSQPPRSLDKSADKPAEPSPRKINVRRQTKISTPKSSLPDRDQGSAGRGRGDENKDSRRQRAADVM